MNKYFDTASLIAILISIQTIWQLSQTWRSFWDDRVTPNDREIAQRLALFVLIPIGILLHEIGHSLATWQVGGTVVSFQWRFYWGYIIPSGNFSAVEYWWIAFSGNLVSILLGLLAIPFIFYVRKRILGEVLYYFACAQLIYALIGYPVLSIVLHTGDWVKIYDFAVQPYATATLIGHIVLVLSLWQLYHSQKAIHWRLAANSNILNTWRKLKTEIAKTPDDLQLNLELAYLLLQNHEVREAKKIARQVYRIAPHEQRVKVFRVVMAYNQRAYRKAIQAGKQLLNTELSAENQQQLYRILSFSLRQIKQLREALYYADLGLAADPDNYQLRCHRGILHRSLGHYQDSQVDFDIALENAPDEDSRQQLQLWLKHYLNQS